MRKTFRWRWNRLKWYWHDFRVWLNNFYVVPCRPPPRAMCQDDIGSNPDANNVKIWLDGVRQTECVSYDIDEGVVGRYVVVDGQPSIDRVHGVFRTEEVRGRVKVRWIDHTRVLPWEAVYGETSLHSFLIASSRK